MEGTDRPSGKWDEMHRLQPPLSGLLGIFTHDLLSLFRIAEWIGYAVLYWCVSYFLRTLSVTRTFVAISCTGLITAAAPAPGLNHPLYSSPLLMKRGTI